MGDTTKAGYLDKEQMWKATSMLDEGITRVVFDEIFNKLDHNREQGFAFREFIVFLRSVMDCVGASAGNHKITELYQLSRSEIMHVMGILGVTLEMVEHLNDDA